MQARQGQPLKSILSVTGGVPEWAFYEEVSSSTTPRGLSWSPGTRDAARVSILGHAGSASPAIVLTLLARPRRSPARADTRCRQASRGKDARVLERPLPQDPQERVSSTSAAGVWSLQVAPERGHRKSRLCSPSSPGRRQPVRTCMSEQADLDIDHCGSGPVGRTT
jgi:hypothetical protein